MISHILLTPKYYDMKSSPKANYLNFYPSLSLSSALKILSPFWLLLPISSSFRSLSTSRLSLLSGYLSFSLPVAFRFVPRMHYLLASFHLQRLSLDSSDHLFLSLSLSAVSFFFPSMLPIVLHYSSFLGSSIIQKVTLTTEPPPLQ